MDAGEQFVQLASLAYATGEPAMAAHIKQHADDFRVDEELGFQPTGSGEHLFLRIEKTDQSTTDVARTITSTFGISDKDVGYSGMKDRRARTRQWFSIKLDAADSVGVEKLESDKLSILEQARNQRKLQIGAHRANHFELVLRNVTGSSAELEVKLQSLQAQGVPNYFGSQRFGRDLSNLHQVLAMMRAEEGKPAAGSGRYRHRRKRSILYSAARAYLFNQLLSKRIELGNWSDYLEGDVLNLDHTKRYFVVEPGGWDGELQQRLRTLDIHISGLLPGLVEAKDRYVTRGQAADIENAVCEEFAEIVSGLKRQGLKAARRPLRFQVQQLRWQWLDAETLSLAFSLPTGAYATSMLREVCQVQENKPGH